jgi:hypothetical protein
MVFAIEEVNNKKVFSIDDVEVMESEWTKRHTNDAINVSECRQYINKHGALCLAIPTPTKDITVNLSF